MAPGAINIVLAADENYAMPLATTVRSVVESHVGAAPLNFFVLADGITPASQSLIRTSCPPTTTIDFIDCEDIEVPHRRETQSLEYLSRTTCLRALIGTLIPESIERVLYFDTDLLILDDVEGLWEVTLTAGSAFGAVVDAGIPTHSSFREGRDAYPRADPGEPYFNSGVLVIDMKAWKANDIGPKTLEVLSDPASVLPMMDQDALNYVAAGMWTHVDPVWNCAADYYFSGWNRGIGFGNPLPYTNIEPKILHFCGRNKPWHTSYPFRAGYRRYRKVRDKTAWPTGLRERIRAALKPW